MNNFDINNIDWSMYKGRDKRAEKAYISFCEQLANRGHELLSPYVNSQTKVYIDFKCGHDPREVKPNN